MVGKRVRAFLDLNEIKYVTVQHSPAYTAQEIAASAHIPGRELAKTVVVRIDDRLALAVVPASSRVSPVALEPRGLWSSQPTHTPATRSGMKPMNQVSAV